MPCFAHPHASPSCGFPAQLILATQKQEIRTSRSSSTPTHELLTHVSPLVICNVFPCDQAKGNSVWPRSFSCIETLRFAPIHTPDLRAPPCRSFQGGPAALVLTVEQSRATSRSSSASRTLRLAVKHAIPAPRTLQFFSRRPCRYWCPTCSRAGAFHTDFPH